MTEEARRAQMAMPAPPRPWEVPGTREISAAEAALIERYGNAFATAPERRPRRPHTTPAQERSEDPMTADPRGDAVAAEARVVAARIAREHEGELPDGYSFAVDLTRFDHGHLYADEVQALQLAEPDEEKPNFAEIPGLLAFPDHIPVEARPTVSHEDAAKVRALLADLRAALEKIFGPEGAQPE